MESFVLDANLYISYFVVRDEAQFKIASNYIKDLENGTIKIVLPSLILAEVVYILHKFYEFERSQIADVLTSLVYETNLIMSDKEAVLSSLEVFKSTELDFADCYLIGMQENSQHGVITFDKKLQKHLDH
jgi:predicted nucleic-acid-binding protein